jgi:hypothetical protein
LSLRTRQWIKVSSLNEASVNRLLDLGILEREASSVRIAEKDWVRIDSVASQIMPRA